MTLRDLKTTELIARLNTRRETPALRAELARRRQIAQDRANTPKRDSATCDHIDAAIAAVQEALKSMPNRVESVFDADDARRLSEVERQLCIVGSARTSIQRVVQDPSVAIYYEGGTVDRFWLAPAGLGMTTAKIQRIGKLYRSREGARRGLLALQDLELGTLPAETAELPEERKIPGVPDDVTRWAEEEGII